LNYSRLGQPVLDKHLFGLHTHLYTFNDLSEIDLAAKWGFRYAKGEKSAVFKYSNPYSAATLSDLFGTHCNIPNPRVPVKKHKLKEHKHLTISKAYWFPSDQRPDWIEAAAVPKNNDGHILLHIDERFEAEGVEQYRTFYDNADKRFILKSEGHPNVNAEARRGYWGQEFYVRIPEKEYVKMKPGVSYSIHAVNSNSEYQWKVCEGVVIQRLEK
jgi:hypothetical protein